MDLLANLATGFGAALDPANMMYCFLGVLLGTIIGVLPGVGPTATISMLLPVTYYLGPEASLIMLAGIYYGSQYGGSTTAILINLPGEVSSSVTALDGYPMAQKGRGGAALAVAALGSFAAGSFATLLIAVLAVPLSRVALQFGSTEYFALIVLGVFTATALAHGSVIKAIAMIVTGMLFGTIGTDIYSGQYRFIFGDVRLTDGLPVVALALGVFGIAEIMRNLGDSGQVAGAAIKVKSIFPTKEELMASLAPIVRGTLLGSLLGTLPGGGSILSAFSSYALEKKISKTPERFGHGAIEGVAGPESANNAGAQTSFIPMLTLGIPSNALMALLAGALMIQGITPGPNVVHQQPALFWGVIVSMWIGNAMLVVLNLPLVGLWVALLKIPYHFKVPAIVAFSTIGVYSMTSQPLDVYVLMAFGLFGYLLSRLGCEPAPLLLGFVMGPLLEDHLRRALVLSNGDFFVFFRSPISLTLLLITAGVLLLASVPAIASRREKVFVEDD
jgi:TctA family transporter